MTEGREGDCCQPRDPANKATCPVNGKSYGQVSYKTVLHQLRQPWAHTPKEQAYYFCTDPDCEVVYFAADNTLFQRADLRQAVGQKSRAADRPLCYCFDIRWNDALQSAQAKAFVLARTRESQCDCAIRNPSGKCCLKDFPKQAANRPRH